MKKHIELYTALTLCCAAAHTFPAPADLSFPAGTNPIAIRREIESRLEEASSRITLEQQYEAVHASMADTAYLLTGETELPETESEISDAEDGSDTSDGSDLNHRTDPSTADTETAWPVPMSVNAQPAVTTVRHGILAVPSIEAFNPARICLYDYRMLRTYPLTGIPKDLHALYDEISSMVSTYDGNWSVYVQNLSTNQALLVNDAPMRSASVMKLFIMAALYDAFDKNQIERSEESVSLMRDMIINSSNGASNKLLALLGDGDLSAGIAVVNDYIHTHGYTAETIEYNGFQDDSAIVDPNHANTLTAKDVGLLMSRIYHRSFISRKVCNEIESMLLDQSTRYKIPRGLPEGVEVGNKSGETDNTANDAAIVYGQNTDYILIVLSNKWSSEDAANANIVNISEVVYRFFEG